MFILPAASNQFILLCIDTESTEYNRNDHSVSAQTHNDAIETLANSHLTATPQDHLTSAGLSITRLYVTLLLAFIKLNSHSIIICVFTHSDKSICPRHFSDKRICLRYILDKLICLGDVLDKSMVFCTCLREED